MGQGGNAGVARDSGGHPGAATAGAGERAHGGVAGACTGTWCDGECVDTATNSEHCGSCGHACSMEHATDAMCDAGLCFHSCQADWTDCERPATSKADDGCETHLSTDALHCGACDRPCATTNVRELRCEDGLCTSLCESGEWNWSQPPASAADDGCESICPHDTGGPEMVKLPDGYCIDSTEVTQAQYDEWLQGSPDPKQPSECSWNVNFVPNLRSNNGKEVVWDPVNLANYPVVGVDWCDAHAFCQDIGRRLCGNRDPDQPLPYEAYGDASQSQWYNACVSGNPAENTYPYGGTTYHPELCNGANGVVPDTWGALPVGTFEGCQSSVVGYQHVFDLIGNVYEWEDSCVLNPGNLPDDYCQVRGSDWGGSVEGDGCARVNPIQNEIYSWRGAGTETIGFRCCYR